MGKKKRKDENKGIGSGVGSDFGLENASHRCHCQAKSMCTAEEPTPTAHAPQWRCGAVAKPLPLTSSNSLKHHLMGVAYLRDTGARTLRIVLASSEAGKGWSYRARVMRWHAGEYPVWVRILLSARARPLGAAL